MNERRLESAGSRSHESLASDLRALGRESTRDLPPLETFVRPARHRPRAWEEFLMATFQLVHRRPWMSAGLAGALLAVALLVVPLSYERTTGHTVRLRLGGAQLDPARAETIAAQMKRLLHASALSMQVRETGGGALYELFATVPNAADRNVAAAANAFCSALGRMGYRASAEVAPVRERVNGSVYAYARDRVIEVNIDGKTAAQIEDEIRRGLASAGVPNAQVSVTRNDAAGRHDLELNVDALKTVTGPDGHPVAEPLPRLVLRQGDAEIAGQGFSVREEMHRDATGSTLTLHIEDGARAVDVSVPHADAAGDAAIGAQVESQLRAAGIEANVTVTRGRVQIGRRR